MLNIVISMFLRYFWCKFNLTEIVPLFTHISLTSQNMIQGSNRNIAFADFAIMIILQIHIEKAYSPATISPTLHHNHTFGWTTPSNFWRSGACRTNRVWWTVCRAHINTYQHITGCPHTAHPQKLRAGNEGVAAWHWVGHLNDIRKRGMPAGSL